MSDPKHTPGPWHARRGPGVRDTTWICRADPVPRGELRIIATLDGPPDSPDARLIAVAPKLRDALDALLVAIGDMHLLAEQEATRAAQQEAEVRAARCEPGYFSEYLEVQRRHWGLDRVDAASREADALLTSLETTGEAPPQ